MIGSTWSFIVDNTTAGRFTASANWGTSTYSAQRYGADYRYATPVAASDAAWFKFNIPSSGNYEVQVWYPAGYNAATPFVIATSSGDYNAVGVSRWTSGTGYVLADGRKAHSKVTMNFER